MQRQHRALRRSIFLLERSIFKARIWGVIPGRHNWRYIEANRSAERVMLCLCSDCIEAAQRQQGTSLFVVGAVRITNDSVRYFSLMFFQSYYLYWIEVRHPDIVFKKLLLNNTNPQLLHQFSDTGFFQGHLSKNNYVDVCDDYFSPVLYLFSTIFIYVGCNCI